MSHYINNKEFYNILVEYKKECEEAENTDSPSPRIPEKVGEAFFLIATKLSNKGNFSGYTYKDEMVGDAIENCVMATRNFDPEKSKNPFAYFTQITWYAFLRRIEKEKKQTYVKYKTYENAVVLDDMFHEMNESAKSLDGYSSNGMDIYNEKMVPIIEKFEKKKKTKKKPKGVEKFVDKNKK
jgi:hypothetical protein